MGLTKKGAPKSKAPASCLNCDRWKDAKESVRAERMMEVLGATINKIEDQLKAAGFKPTVGDYLKLMQMERELVEVSNDAKEIKVTWIEPEKSENEA